MVCRGWTGVMADTKDSAIKLFGKAIYPPECPLPARTKDRSDSGSQILGRLDITEMIEPEYDHEEESKMPHKPCVIQDSKEENHEISKLEMEGKVDPNLKEEEDMTSEEGQERIKKPDKILPCPRCNSLETKFCYFNNYNVNQPRHFCKSCQRYWTAGGTMRNVPIGAGRRKNKHLASPYHQILLPRDANQHHFSSAVSQASLRPQTGNGTLLEFGPEGHLRESMANAADMVCTRENKETPSSCGSAVTASIIQENEVPNKVKEQEILPRSENELTEQNPMQCCPIAPSGFPWNHVLDNAASMVADRCSSELFYQPNACHPNTMQWCSTPLLAVPGLQTPSIPVQFVPGSCWGCLPVWTSGTRNTPAVGLDVGLSSTPSTMNKCLDKNAPTLGKHSRDGILIDEEKTEEHILVPKILRVDDPERAMRSSPVWAILGSNPNRRET